jgi:endonuclease YncB( thermonuclease family)
MDAYTYKATVRSVHDGDTIHADIDLGFGLTKGSDNSVPGVLLRLSGCNARELGEEGGREVRDRLLELLPTGMEVTLRTVRPDKYGGRFDAVVELPDGRDLVSVLIDEGWVAPWDGEGERPVPVWPTAVA